MIDATSPAGANISTCRRFRYHWHRRWREGDTALFVMLNPSTADAEQMDPTVTRCRNFAEAWGYAGVEVVNLYAYRATDPRDLKRAGYPRAPLGFDDEVIREAARLHRSKGIVVVAWGANAPRERAAEVLELIRDEGATPHALALTASGQPGHPLYLPANLVPLEFVGGLA